MPPVTLLTPTDTEDGVGPIVTGLVTIVRKFEHYRGVFAAQHDLTVSGARALARIFEAGSLTPKDLAAQLELTTGSVTPVLDALENSGLIERMPNPEDRRSILLQASAKGRATVIAANDDLRAHIGRAVSGAPEELLRELSGYLESIADSFDD